MTAVQNEFKLNLGKTGFAPVPNPVAISPIVSLAAKGLYALLLSYAWNGVCYPGRQTLSKNAGVHPNTIDKLVKELKDAGLITVSRRGVQQTNLYEFIPVSDTSLSLSDSAADRVIDTSVSDVSDTRMSSNNKQLLSINTLNTSNTNVLEGAPGAQEEGNMATQHSLFKLPEPTPPSLPKGASNSQKAMYHVSEARAGRLPWSKVSDLDFAHYYVIKHNGCMPKLVTFDMYTSTGVIRDSLVKTYDIPREKVCDYIDTILAEYQNHPDNQTWLSFNMIQKNGPLMNQLVELVRRKLETVERKFQMNVAPMKLGKVEEGETF